MRHLEPTTVELNNESTEINKIFDGQSKFLKGLMVFAVLQYFLLLNIL